MNRTTSRRPRRQALVALAMLGAVTAGTAISGVAIAAPASATTRCAKPDTPI